MTSAFVSSRLSRQKMETAEAQAIEFQCEFGQLDASELLEEGIEVATIPWIDKSEN